MVSRHKILRLPVRNSDDVEAAETILSNLAKEKWMIVEATFVDEGNTLMVLLEYLEIDNFHIERIEFDAEDENDDEPWKSK